MLKSKAVKALAVYVPILIMGMFLLGGCRHSGPERIIDRITERIKSKLELNVAQQEQLDAIKGELLAKMAEMKKDRISSREELLTQLQSDVIDQTRIRKLLDKKRANMDELSNMMIDRLARFHATLSKEQKEKLVKYLKDRHDCMN
jgi:periplasmic protein CpxP/Spy